MMSETGKKQYRVAMANRFIGVIGSYGRKFLEKDGRFDVLYLNDRGHIYYNQAWNDAHIFVGRLPPHGRWRGFTHGGTLMSLVKMLVQFVRTGKKLHPHYFSDHWGYGDDMPKVINEGKALGVIEP